MPSIGLPWTLQEARTEKARRSLYEYVRHAWYVVEPAAAFVDGWHIGAIVEHLEAVSRVEIRSLIINIPPRHMKSLLVSVFWPTWSWIDHPELRWLYASYAQSLSTRDSLKSRRVIQSQWYQERWGDRYSLTSDQNAKTRFENNHTGYRLATSVGGSATGEGGDRIVVDDPHNVHEAESEAIREGVLAWWDGVMTLRVNDPRASARVLVMQRVHEKDLSGHLLEQGGWEHLCIPAEYEAPRFTVIGWQDPRTTQGELVWPNRFGPGEIARTKRELGSYRYAGQYQQRPSPQAGGIFERKHLRFYSELPRREDEAPDFEEMLQSWDMAFKDLSTSDYVVGQVWGRKGADAYLLDQVRGHLSFTESLAAVGHLAQKWPRAAAILVEDKANGTAVLDTLRHRLSGLIAVEPAGGKVARAYAIQPYYEAGNVYFPSPEISLWTGDLVEELASFPNGAHDDQVDAMTQALMRLLSRPAVRVRMIR